MSMHAIYKVLASIKKQFVHYFNPIGKLYIIVQFLCRVMIPQFVLDKMFSDPVLVCDTRQIGCEQNCINRFTPINHQRIWEVELLMIIVSLIVFWLFSTIHREVKKINRKKYNKFFGFENRPKGGSKITKCGYIVMLHIVSQP